MRALNFTVPINIMNVTTFVCPVLNQFCKTNILSADEIEASYKYKNPLDRFSRLQSHLLKRIIIGYFSGIDPSWLIFQSLPKGKPYVVNAPLSFNVTHTREYIAISIVPSSSIDIGVDVESLKSIPEDEAYLIASLVLIPEEMTIFLAHENPTEYLLQCWTIKESIMKACGLGIYCDPLCLSTSSDNAFTSDQVVDRWQVAIVGVGGNCILSQSHRAEDSDNSDLQSECYLLNKQFLLSTENLSYDLAATMALDFDTISAYRFSRPFSNKMSSIS